MEKTNIIEAAADDAVAAAAVGGAAVAAKKGVDAIKKGLKGLSKQSREEKVDKMFDKPMEQLDKQIEQAKERVSDFVEDKEDADNPNKKEQIQKKIEKAQDVVKKLEAKKRALKEKKRKAKESIFGKLESREHAICSIVLGENFDLDFLKTNIQFLNNKPSKIKEAYKKFINEKESIDENRAIVYNPRMIRAFIKKAEKKFPKYKGEIQQIEKDEIVFPDDDKLRDFFRGAKEVKFVLKDSVEIEEAKKDFKPHMMYDPKTGKGYKANTHADHLKMKDMGYTHEKPTDIGEAVKFWTVTITKKAGKLFKGQTVDVKARNSAEAIKKGIKQMKGNPALVPGDSVDAVLGESIVEKGFSFKEYTETLDEKQIKGLQKKADETGIPYGILKKVFDRGMAAWKTGHRPGATPHQWAFARVNSFATKSKGTWGGADKDLAAKVK